MCKIRNYRRRNSRQTLFQQINIIHKHLLDILTNDHYNKYVQEVFFTEKELKKQYNLLTAMCMVVGTVIGSGVFFKAQSILKQTNGDMPMGILAWLVGGLVMLFCILAFSVMAQKYEKVNGVIDYAEATVGSRYAYLVGWFITAIYGPTQASVLAWLSAKYFLIFVCSVNPDLQLTIPFAEGGAVNGPETLCVAGFILIAVYTMNSLSSKIAGKFQVSATFIKLIPLLLMGVFGIVYGLTHTIGNEPITILEANFSTASGDFSTLFGSVIAAAFAYEGWIMTTSINAELKNAKRNLPIALVGGALIIITVYIIYYIGVAGGATAQDLQTKGATVAFTNVFGNVFGNVLNLFVAISCLGTLNGLLLGSIRGMFSLAVRGYGPFPRIFRSVDKATQMPVNSAVIGLFIISLWLLFYYGANLTPNGWFGYFNFDSSELPVVTLYALYIPIFIMFMIKEKNLSPIKRFLLPLMGIAGSVFMVFAAIYAYGYLFYIEAKENGVFSCPILFYLIIFIMIMISGILVMNPRKSHTNKKQRQNG